MATIREIAELAGVSRGTVDRVLNHRGSVNAATAALVNDIAKNWTTSQTAPGSPSPHSERWSGSASFCSTPEIRFLMKYGTAFFPKKKN